MMLKTDWKKFNVSRSSTEVYYLRQPDTGLYWANIIVDAADSKLGLKIVTKEPNRVHIASDYGNWQASWGGVNEPFKEFLTKLNMEYAADRFRVKEVFDNEKTRQAWKGMVIWSRRNGNLPILKARLLWDEIDSLSGHLNQREFEEEYFKTRNLREFLTPNDKLEFSLPKQFIYFWQGPWQAFINQLKTELSSAAKDSTPPAGAN